MQTRLDIQKGVASPKINVPIGLVATMFICVLTYQLNITMLTPALPNIAESLNVGVDRVSKVSSLLLLVASLSGIVLARWSDYIGRRRAFFIILILMEVGSLMCIFAPNFTVLMMGRILQGATGAAFQLCYVILKETLNAKTFGIVLGIITSVNAGVAGIDGYVGGLLSDYFGFRAIFVVIFVIGLLAILGVNSTVPKNRNVKTCEKMDWWGALAISIVLICMTNIINQGSTVGWLNPITILYFIGMLVAMIAFWLVEKNSNSPLIAVHHLRSRQVWPVISTTLLSLSGVFAVINFIIVILSQDKSVGFGHNAATTGILFLMPVSIIALFSAPLSGWLAGKWGWIRVLQIGQLCSIAALIVIVLFSQSQLVVVLSVATLGISYYGMILTTVNGLGVVQSPDEAPSALPGINGAAFGIGASLGISVVSPIVAHGTVSGYTTALWVSIAITILAFISSLFIAPKQV